MELARQYIRRADGLWRRHKARAVTLALAAAACATGWLVKPVKPEDLLGILKKLLPGA